MSEELICIPKLVYEEMLDDQLLLNCLRAAGVDNWSGYDFALETYEEHYNKESE
jgi:hypothetical protein